jgi:DNA-binding GntR family transcriptional regulator
MTPAELRDACRALAPLAIEALRRVVREGSPEQRREAEQVLRERGLLEDET